jgi:hypothetical protein
VSGALVIVGVTNYRFDNLRPIRFVQLVSAAFNPDERSSFDRRRQRFAMGDRKKRIGRAVDHQRWNLDIGGHGLADGIVAIGDGEMVGCAGK